MTSVQAKFLSFLLICSVGFLVVPAAAAFIRWLTRKKKDVTRKKPMSTGMKLVVASVFLLLSILTVRFSIGYYGIITAPADESTLTWWEELVNSLLSSLKTFGIIEEFGNHLIDGRKMMGAIVGEGSIRVSLFAGYLCLLNFTAPIAGGAIVFEILASIFPSIRLWVSFGMFWRDKYFFSELNERSLALVRSLKARSYPRFRSPVFIFTDTYVDDENEKSSELAIEARLLGAICVRDDLAHIKKNKKGRRTFYLIDENENGNLQALTDLANDANNMYLRDAEVYLFSQNDNYKQVEKQVCEKLVRDYRFRADSYAEEERRINNGESPKKDFKNELPVIIPVQSYRNLVINLLEDLPLYEPLVNKKKKADGTTELTVTVFGAGQTGIEMFLATYWYGQILDCKLTVNMISMESEEAFRSRIDYVNPEILRTTDADDSILEYNKNGDKSEPYCTVNYIEAKIGNGSSIESLGKECGINILDTDYFLVALGSDELDLSVAESLRRCVGINHLGKEDGANTVIAYVVYDSELCSVLNQSCVYSSDNRKNDIYMRAVGSLEEVYSTRNIHMTDSQAAADEIHMKYMTAQGKKEYATEHEKRRNDDYKYWANIARKKHFKYKVFSMGLVNVSVFDTGRTDCTEYIEAQAKAAAGFKAIVESTTRDLELMHRMAWLEHRRWNAFTRVKGFRHSDRYTDYYDEDKGGYKHMELKLHPCLVECDKLGIKAEFDEDHKLIRDSVFKWEYTSVFDYLDELSYELKWLGYNDYDFKEYDYPEHESF